MFISGLQSDPSRPSPRVRQLVALFLLLGTVAVGSNLLVHWSEYVTVLWPCSGLTLGVLLLAPRRHWTSYISVAFVVDLATNIVFSSGDPVVLSVLVSLCNTVEILLAASLLTRVLPAVRDLRQFQQLVKFLAIGVILAPAIASFLAWRLSLSFGNPDLLVGYGGWLGADVLGMGTMTPLVLAFSYEEPLRRRSWQEVSGLLILIVMVTLLAFGQNRYLLIFAIAPFLQFAGWRLGLVGSACGLIIVSILGGCLTSFGLGPMHFMPNASVAEHIQAFQFFIGFSILMLYGTEVMTHRNNALQEAVVRSEGRFRLLAETSRDIILLSDLEGRCMYVSPAVTEILGWSPERLVSKTYEELVHPDDLENIVSLMDTGRIGKSRSGVFRCRRLDGTYRWIETTIGPYQDANQNQTAGLVSVMRDVSRRVAAEEELKAAYETARALATVDGLTGIANRRRLDEVLDQECRRAGRDGSEISFLLFDVDHFKAYNDIYGHLAGDDCLRQIAKAAQEIIKRPADLIARFGGEEFAVILPSTSAEGCREIAEEIRLAITMKALLHRGNPAGIVTVSLGCATMIPNDVISSTCLIEGADQALYKAKSSGRNRVRSSSLGSSPISKDISTGPEQWIEGVTAGITQA
jgi:diguanylate cyclase (GGDEF)-like protein/PAS domain S-box-containing protein